MAALKRVIVVGTGSLGGRHTQAMARVTSPIDLDIVDPVPAARERAISWLASAGGLRHGTVRQFERVEDAGAAPDVAIVATNARERPKVIRSLLALGARSLILEKVLFTRLRDHDEMDDEITAAGARAWVNCVRNAYPRAKRLKELVGGAAIQYCVEGQGWGLGCNLVHHLEEFSRLSGETDIRLDTAELEPTVEGSKRPGYIEFFGRVSGTTANGATFAAICRRGDPRPRTTTINIGARHVTVSPEQILFIKDSEGSRSEPYPWPLQSELSDTYVEAVLGGDSPSLPDYASASRLHRIMLKALLEHLRDVRGDHTIDECPVT